MVIILTKWTGKNHFSSEWDIFVGCNRRKYVIDIFDDEGKINIDLFGPSKWETTRHWLVVRQEENYNIRESSWLELLILTGVTKERALDYLQQCQHKCNRYRRIAIANANLET